MGNIFHNFVIQDEIICKTFTDAQVSYICNLLNIHQNNCWHFSCFCFLRIDDSKVIQELTFDKSKPNDFSR